MQCAYCKSEMAADATVCAACTRRQPMSGDARFRLVLAVAAGLIFVPTLAWGTWAAIDNGHRQDAVRRIVECAHLHGDKIIDADFVNFEIDDGMKQTGKSWRAGIDYAALVLANSGDSIAARCFITRETLFPD